MQRKTLSTVREHYDVTAKALNVNREWHLRLDGADHPVVILSKISYRQEENAKYWSFYIPQDAELSCVRFLFEQKNVRECYIDEKEPEQVIGAADRPERQSLSSFVFTQRIYLYIEKTISDKDKILLDDLGKSYGFDVLIRDESYIEECMTLSKPAAFISHDSRDKDEIVRELATHLNTRLFPVWYDEFSLSVGDSLRQSIEEGLKEARYCILVLSRNFFENKGWAKREFDSIYTREVIEGNNIVLPVWHGVDKKDVYNYSPILADKVGIPTDVGIDKVASELIKKIRPEI